MSESHEMGHVEPQAEHRWLRQLVGEWTYEMEMPPGEGHPEGKVTGTETVRALGDLWVVLEGRGQMPGGDEAVMQMTLGYDPARKAVVGTWIASMMAYLWVYEGRLRADGRALELESDGPDMKGEGRLVRYMDVVEMVSPDHRTLTGHVRGEDGSWQPITTTHYHRKR